jgi:hypothetical protein
MPEFRGKGCLWLCLHAQSQRQKTLVTLFVAKQLALLVLFQALGKVEQKDPFTLWWLHSFLLENRLELSNQITLHNLAAARLGLTLGCHDEPILAISGNRAAALGCAQRLSRRIVANHIRLTVEMNCDPLCFSQVIEILP